MLTGFQVHSPIEQGLRHAWLRGGYTTQEPVAASRVLLNIELSLYTEIKRIVDPRISIQKHIRYPKKTAQCQRLSTYNAGHRGMKTPLTPAMHPAFKQAVPLAGEMYSIRVCGPTDVLYSRAVAASVKLSAKMRCGQTVKPELQRVRKQVNDSL